MKTDYLYYLKQTSLILVLSLCFVFHANGQNYNYLIESFEEPVWASATSSPTVISSSTGDWSAYKGNIQSTAAGSADGDYALVFTVKTGLITPMLPNGVGVLTYSAVKTTGGTRTITLESSVDNANWTTVDSYNTAQTWEERTVKVNDPSIRYLRFTTNSNGSTYIDKLLITKAGASDITVLTNEASSISHTSAIINGVITTGESLPITERGVCFSTTPNPDYDSDKVISSTTNNDFIVEMKDLLSNTTYYVKAYSQTSAGINYGNEVSFTTRVGDDIIYYWTQPFDNTSYFPATSPTSAQTINVPGQGDWIYLKAYKNTNSAYIVDGSAYGIRMLKSGSYVVTPILEDGVIDLTFDEGRKGKTITIYTSTDKGATWTKFTSVTTDMNGRNRVIVNSAEVNRLKISNDSSNDADIDNVAVTVFPNGDRPTIITGNATNIAINEATVTSQITSNGDKAIVERGICWSTETIPLIDDNKIIDPATSNEFTINIIGLPAGETIYYRAYATSRAGTGYGEVKNFKTNEPLVPELATIAATNITGETALSGANITNLGGGKIIEMGVCWSANQNPTIDDSKVITEGETTGFEVELRPLTANTTYYYRAFVKTNAGIGYGQQETLTTGSIALPEVKTISVESSSPFQALVKGSLISTGNAITTKGFCYSTNSTPSIDDYKVVVDGIATDFIATLTGLKSNTTYYLCAFATNNAGTVYGDEIIFKTQSSTVYYVSPDGNDETGNGTEVAPYYSLHKVVDLVTPGDQIIMKGGTYNYTTRINISAIGEPQEGMISLRAEEGKRALLDFSAMAFDADNQGIRLTGSYWHFYGLDIKGAGDNGMLIERNKPVGGTYNDVVNNSHEAHHNIIEFCTFFENKDTGLQLKNLAENNRIINCDAYWNADPDNGDADGFAPKLTLGNGNYFYGCRSWNNSDDGWDGYLKATEGGFPDDMTTVLENCWTFNNGYLKDGSIGKGNGNGFKLGGNSQRHNMILKRCLGFNNLVKTFDQNSNTGDMILINCTGYAKRNTDSNQRTYRLEQTVAPGKQIKLTNCIAVWDGLDSKKSAYGPVSLANHTEVTCDFRTEDADFVSVDPTGADGPRKADGSLPDLDFMKIKPGNTKLIDAGTIVDGISYNGTAPDLGWQEYTPDATSIEEILSDKTENSSLTIYPQPIQDNFTVLLNNEVDPMHNRIRIFDTNGALQYQEDYYGNSINVKCTNVNSGIYILVISNSNSIYQQKIIIK